MKNGGITKYYQGHGFGRAIIGCVVFGLMALSVSPRVLAAGQPKLSVMMYEQTPLLVHDAGVAKGHIGDRAQRILQDTGFDFTVGSYPPIRILSTLKQDSGPDCTFAFFKTGEREAFARYSLPFFQDLPQGIMVRKSNLAKFEGHKTFIDVLKDQNIYMGHMKDVSLGPVADALVLEHKTKIAYGNDLERIFDMLQHDRFDCILTDAIKGNAALEKFSLNTNDYTVLTFDDSPKGSKRYFLCAKNLGEGVMAKINTSIKKLVGDKLLPH
jgi:polar amino acid transport system substrate-binding protein